MVNHYFITKKDIPSQEVISIVLDLRMKIGDWNANIAINSLGIVWNNLLL